MEPDADPASYNGEPIPSYRIDLSLPPEERYVRMAQEMGPRMRMLVPLFDFVVGIYIPWAWGKRSIRFLAWVFLRRVFSPEQTIEIKSIAKHVGCSLYLLVALNVLLDSLLGCTSGGVMTRADGKKENDDGYQPQQERMMHFRTLDWGMDELRSIICELEFVRSASPEPEKVLARTVTEDLSVSLNFRPNHNCSIISLRIHQLKVLLGFRPAIGSCLRDAILAEPLVMPQGHDSLRMTIERLNSIPTAPCYVILCDGITTAVIERDLKTNDVRSSREFIVHTNHDTDSAGSVRPGQDQRTKNGILSMEGWLEESEDRMNCLTKRWNSLRRRHDKKQQADGVRAGDLRPPVVREELLRKWMATYPITNECTHHSMIMDPKTCEIRWLERGVVNVGKEEIAEQK
ncbi:beta subunit of N-acylethanolamine-hydrolyzing acid amidase-domain-containing protein [Rhexocercosporidium sp. MPI-PUGE-AT-0058]|nr:beta subunit of N-acylethanolamine-hydrolyzing acid amidase-domain-containing protein [Rhexocercosporidium sp. MPI-PUGE-AT-0058]